MNASCTGEVAPTAAKRKGITTRYGLEDIGIKAAI